MRIGRDIVRIRRRHRYDDLRREVIKGEDKIRSEQRKLAEIGPIKEERDSGIVMGNKGSRSNDQRDGIMVSGSRTKDQTVVGKATVSRSLGGSHLEVSTLTQRSRGLCARTIR